MVKHFSKRFLLAGLVLITVILTCCIVSVEQVDSNRTTTEALNQAPGVSSDISKSSAEKPVPTPEISIATEIQPYKHTAGAEALELQALEKNFMASKYYQQEKMIPLTVTADRKYFIAYKVSETNIDDENELILIGMPRQQVELYQVDLEEGKSIRLGRTEFIKCS